MFIHKMIKNTVEPFVLDLSYTQNINQVNTTTDGFLKTTKTHKFPAHKKQTVAFRTSFNNITILIDKLSKTLFGKSRENNNR